MVFFIIAAALGLFLFGYFVGSNNPSSKVKSQIIAAAKTQVGKL